MPAYNFKERFVEDIEKKKKRQTIRAERSDGYVPSVGDTAYLYTGLRTKNSRKIGEHKIKKVYKIVINPNQKFCVVLRNILKEDTEFIEEIDRRKLDRFARADGFVNWIDLVRFFKYTHGFPFIGTLIKW